MQKQTDIAKAISSIDLDLSKAGLIELGSHLAIEELEGGYIDSLDRFAQIKQMKLILDGYETAAKEYVLNDLEHQDSGKSQRGRVLIETANSGDRLDYDADPVYKAINEQLKARQKELKMSRTTINIVVDPDGVEVPKVKIKTPGRTIAKVTIK